MKLIFAIIALAGLAAGAVFTPDGLARWLPPAASSAFGGAERAAYLTSEVAIGTIRRTISATGSLQAVSTVEVSSQLSGQIARLHADFNDPVAAGQPLAELDQRSFRARVAQAAAEAQMARENVAILTATLERRRRLEQESIAQRKVFDARNDQARIGLEAAARQLVRAETLASRGTTATTAVDDVRSTRDGAAAQLREAEAAAAAHEHAVASSAAARREAEAELANAEAALPLRDAAVELARLDLERSTIRAPIGGVVVGRNVEQGQTVAVSLDAPVLFTIAGDLSEMEIHANIDETDIGQIAIGQTADFTVDAFPGRVFSARVIEIRKAARLVQGVVTYTVILRTANAEALLLPGMTSTVRIVTGEAGPLPVLPLAALRFAPDGDRADPEAGDAVWVLGADGAARRKAVRLGIDDGRDVALLDGTLPEGASVITGRSPRPAGRKLFGISF